MILTSKYVNLTLSFNRVKSPPFRIPKRSDQGLSTGHHLQTPPSFPKTLEFPLFHTYVTTAMTFFSISTHIASDDCSTMPQTSNLSKTKKKMKKINSFIRNNCKAKFKPARFEITAE
uniref:(northern house mosquito) hypothetical protein n=1 Tax=Culex pipiens TaxID=7175 RepID=A0A8D8CV49_CULPI